MNFLVSLYIFQGNHVFVTYVNCKYQYFYSPGVSTVETGSNMTSMEHVCYIRKLQILLFLSPGVSTVETGNRCSAMTSMGCAGVWTMMGSTRKDHKSGGHHNVIRKVSISFHFEHGFYNYFKRFSVGWSCKLCFGTF